MPAAAAGGLATLMQCDRWADRLAKVRRQRF
jgi:hypothetical protein